MPAGTDSKRGAVVRVGRHEEHWFSIETAEEKVVELRPLGGAPLFGRTRTLGALQVGQR